MDHSFIINRILGALPATERGIYLLHEPFFDELEQRYVQQCIETNWVSYQGAFVSQFEKMLAVYCGAKHAVALVNGTVALYLALKGSGVQAGEEVIVPALTFVATANAVSHMGAIPHFVDADPRDHGIDVEKLEAYLNKIVVFDDRGNAVNKQTGRVIRAIIPVHVFGHPIALDPLQRLAKRYQLMIIEDCAEALGSEYKGKRLGTAGISAILSFNGNKIITTGGGGAVLTNSDALAEKIRHWSTTAKIPHTYEFFHDEIGYNFRLPNINAALGCAQMEKIETFVARKRNLAKTYEKNLAGIDYFSFFVEKPDIRSNYWLNTIVLHEKYQTSKNALIEALHQSGLKCRSIWTPLHQLPMYQAHPRDDLSVTQALYQRVICLPSSVFLSHA